MVNPSSKWLVRISEVFADFTGEIIDGLEAKISKRLGSEYLLIETQESQQIHHSKYVRWNLPIEHSWPCNPEKMEGFIEKAAQAMLQKFSTRSPQAIFVGQLDPSPGNRYYKSLASNLRGRVLQLFPSQVAELKDAEAQRPDQLTLFCLLGKEGLFCGMQSPRESKGFYPGGTKYISQGSADTISRAGAKVAEALHFLQLHGPKIPKTAHWLELGASPGGMTSELLNRGYQVTAIDRAALDKRLSKAPNLFFAMLDVAAFMPNSSMKYDAILCDMNGDARESIRQVSRLARNLKPNGLVIYTLKTAGATTLAEINELDDFAVEMAKSVGLKLLVKTHLTYNRQEFTLFFKMSKNQT